MHPMTSPIMPAIRMGTSSSGDLYLPPRLSISFSCSRLTASSSPSSISSVSEFWVVTVGLRNTVLDLTTSSFSEAVKPSTGRESTKCRLLLFEANSRICNCAYMRLRYSVNDFFNIYNYLKAGGAEVCAYSFEFLFLFYFRKLSRKTNKHEKHTETLLSNIDLSS